VLALHNGWEDRNVDARVNTADDPSTSDKVLVNFSLVTPAFCRRVCGVQKMAVVCCSESVLMRDFDEMEAEIMDQMEVEALP